MAGTRRRGDGQPPKPRVRDLKAARRRQRLAVELGAAETPRQRLAAAVDFVRTCLRASGAPASGPVGVAVLVRQLTEAGDQVWAARHRARLQNEMAAATAGDQLAVAMEYLRRALAGTDDPAVQQTAEELVDPLVRRLVAAGEQMQKGTR
jgi:hypothetical protein